MSLGMEFNWTFSMLLDIIVEKMYFVFKRNIYLSSIIRQEKKGGGVRFLTGRTQEGGGVIQMRTVCNRGGGGV